MNKNIILLALFMIMTIDSSFWLISKTTGTSRIVLTAIVIIILLIFSVARINKKKYHFLYTTMYVRDSFWRALWQLKTNYDFYGLFSCRIFIYLLRRQE